MKPPPELPPRPPILNTRHESDPNAINHPIQVVNPLLSVKMCFFYCVRPVNKRQKHSCSAAVLNPNFCVMIAF